MKAKDIKIEKIKQYMATNQSSEWVVGQSNALAEASYTLSLDEKRLVALAMAKINYSDKDDKLRMSSVISEDDENIYRPIAVKITAEEFAGIYGLDKKSAYNQLYAATNNLSERWITQLVEKNKKIVKRELRWLIDKETPTTSSNEGMVEIHFHPKLEKHLKGLAKDYTHFKLSNLVLFESNDYFRLFEFLLVRKDFSVRTVDIDELREVLYKKSTYPRFAEFNRSVLNPSVESINKNTNYTVTFKTVKVGRTVQKIIFYISEKTPIMVNPALNKDS